MNPSSDPKNENQRDLDRRLAEEIEFHLEQQIEKNLRAGMSEAEARRAARLKFGGVESAREYTRDEFRFAWLEDFARDVRIGLRSLRRTPSFAFAFIVTFALGIGAPVAMFSVYDGILLKPLPYPDSDRIVRLFQISDKGLRGSNISEPNFLDWQAQTKSFEAMAEFNRWETPISGIKDPVVTYTSAVSRSFFDIMRVRPALGRAFLDDELRVGGPKVAVVSNSFWRRMTDDPSRAPGVNDTLRIASSVYTVVGVMPPAFDFPLSVSVWTPREQDPPQTSRTAHNFQVIARLRDGVSLEGARADIGTVSRALKAVYKDGTAMKDATALPLLEVLTGTARGGLNLLFAASLLLLVVAAANVSNLLIARAQARSREFAIQLSLGATRGRLIRRSIAEALVLCATGGTLGIVIAAVVLRLFLAVASASPRTGDVTINLASVLFAAGLSFAVAIALSVFMSAGRDTKALAPALMDSTRGSSSSRGQARARHSLIVVELAVTLVLLVGAGLLAKSLQAVMAIDPGFSLDNALVADISLNWAQPLPQQVAFRDRLMEKVASLPGVASSSYVSDFPLGGSGYANGTFTEMTRPDEFPSWDLIRALSPEERAARQAEANYRLAGPGYFEAMKIPILRGRGIGPEDRPDAPQVAVISESLAKTKWQGQDPIGRFIQFGNMDGDQNGMRIVGIAGDIHELSLEAAASPTVYGAAQQRPVKAARFSLIVRGPEPMALGDAIRRIARELDPEAAVRLRTMEGAIDAALVGRKFYLWLVGAFSVVAFALAAFGVYGLISYSVAQRVREIGIRKVLGAENRDLVAWIVKGALGLAGIGVAIGIVCAFFLGGVLKSLLYGVQTTDATVLATVALLTLATAAFASWLPARRVVSIAPTESLREG